MTKTTNDIIEMNKLKELGYRLIGATQIDGVVTYIMHKGFT